MRSEVSLNTTSEGSRRHAEYPLRSIVAGHPRLWLRGSIQVGCDLRPFNDLDIDGVCVFSFFNSGDFLPIYCIKGVILAGMRPFICCYNKSCCTQR